ncbi:MAG TPA: hypothetical protein VMT86_00245, partial [Bryobacteraceae bacterium]|nr:hypothetical protein [Bryobacteraceae bacterium]
QAGLFRNQETYAFLEPRQTIRFSEYWMPARGIGGIARANLYGVLNLARHADTVTASFNANQAIPQASLRILQGAALAFGETADLAPEHTWSHETKNAAQGPYTFELRDAKGHVLLRHTEGRYDWTPASEIQTGPQPRLATGDTLELGTDHELQGELLLALGSYQEGLRRAPGDFELSFAAGRLLASLQRYVEAIPYLESAAARATSNPEIAYYLGLAYDGTGGFAHARRAYEAAARMPSFRAAASLKLGELLARSGDGDAALESLHAAKRDLRAAEETIALERALGRPLEASPEGPPSAFLEWDADKGRDAALLRFLAADPERVLEIAAEYMRLGLYRRALDLLARDFPAVPASETEPGAVLPQQHPMVVYYRGYCREKLGESADADYQAAQKLSTLYVFPSRAEDLEVLRAVLRTDPGDMTAHYLLGTQYFARGLTADALAEWNTARRAHAAIPVLDADIGLALLREKHDWSGAVEAFREGLPIDPSNLKLYEGLDSALSLLGRPPAELAAALEKYPDLANMPTELVYSLALVRAEAGEFDRALALFHDRFFVREEGGTNVREVWVEVKTRQALSQAQAGQCDSALGIVNAIGAEVPGLPFTKDGVQPFVDAPRTQYRLAQVEAQCGRAEAAKERWRRVAASADVAWAWRAAQKLPDYQEAQWRARAQAALAKSASPETAAMLEFALGKSTEARARVEQILLLPDRHMSHHLARLAG